MAKTKLKQLDVNEVSLVDAGANQHAHVTLFKSRTGEPGDGTQPADKPQSGLRRFFSAIGKALSISEADIEEVVDSIEKADTFNEKMEQRKLNRITDEIWDVCWALENSLCSIIRDDEVTDKAALMNQSIDEFTATIKTLTATWGAGNTVQLAKKAEIPAEHVQETLKRLNDLLAGAGSGNTEEPIGKADGETDPEAEDDDDSQANGETGDTGKCTRTKKSKEGGYPDMKFNEASMTPAELMIFEDLKKRYGVEEEPAPAGEVTEPVGKAGEAAPQPAADPTPAEGGEDIYKGLNPVVKAEIEALKKRAAEADHREMVAVAKNYEILGKDPEELAKTLEGLKAAGGTAYSDMISTLDAAVDVINNSGVFSEIGKKGVAGSNGAEAVTKIETIAKKLQEADPTMSYAVAMDTAWAQHPELVEEYEASR